MTYIHLYNFRSCFVVLFLGVLTSKNMALTDVRSYQTVSLYKTADITRYAIVLLTSNHKYSLYLYVVTGKLFLLQLKQLFLLHIFQLMIQVCTFLFLKCLCDNA